MFVLAHMQGMFVWNIGISVYFVTDITVGFVSVGLAITCEAPRSLVIQEYFICKKREEIFELLSLWSKMIKEGNFGHSHVRTCLGCWWHTADRLCNGALPLQTLRSLVLRNQSC